MKIASFSKICYMLAQMPDSIPFEYKFNKIENKINSYNVHFSILSFPDEGQG